MPRTKHDRSVVASGQYYELKTICARYKIKVKALRAILLEIGQKGKPEHSRKEIYAELENRGYRPGGITVIKDKESGEYYASNGETTSSAMTENDAINGLNE